MSTLEDNSHLPVTNRPETIIGVTTTFISISATAVLLRLYVRHKNRLWGWDDLFVIFAALACLAGSVLTCLMTQHGLGKHFWTLSALTKVEYYKFIWLSNLAYTFSTTFIKIAILAQYLRLFDGRSVLARKATVGALAFVCMWGITFCTMGLLSCVPIEKNWHFETAGRCVGWGSKNPNEFFATWIAHAVSNMCLDTIILGLPVPFIRGLRMNGKTRTGLIMLFAMGGVAVILSLARVISLSIRRIGTVPVYDPSFATPIVFITSVLELNMAILTASIPVFWPLVTSLATNKILIVNEIEIRTERVDNSFALAEQGKGFAGLGDDDGPDGRTSRVDVLCKSDETNLYRNTSRRAAPRSHFGTHSHSTKHSTASDRSVGIDLGRRASHDSQRNLNLTHQTSGTSFNSFSKSSLYKNAPPPHHHHHHHNTHLGNDSPDATYARYQNKFVQDWVVPNFDGDGGAKGSGPPETTFTTSVERAEIPYDHIRALEK